MRFGEILSLNTNGMCDCPPSAWLVGSGRRAKCQLLQPRDPKVSRQHQPTEQLTSPVAPRLRLARFAGPVVFTPSAKRFGEIELSR